MSQPIHACPCPDCDPSGQVFRSWFGRRPDQPRRRRRSHGELLWEAKQRAQLLADARRLRRERLWRAKSGRGRQVKRA